MLLREKSETELRSEMEKRWKTKEQIDKMADELNNLRVSEAEANKKMEVARNKIAKMEEKYKIEMENAKRDITYTKAAKDKVDKSLQTFKRETAESKANYERGIKRLSDHVKELKQANIKDRERSEILREQNEREDIGEYERANNELEITEIEERINLREEQIEGTSLKLKLR